MHCYNYLLTVVSAAMAETAVFMVWGERVLFWKYFWITVVCTNGVYQFHALIMFMTSRWNKILWTVTTCIFPFCSILLVYSIFHRISLSTILKIGSPSCEIRWLQTSDSWRHHLKVRFHMLRRLRACVFRGKVMIRDTMIHQLIGGMKATHNVKKRKVCA
jgi:hypothetical protein